MRNTIKILIACLWIGSTGFVFGQENSTGGWGSGSRHGGQKLGPVARQVAMRMRSQFQSIKSLKDSGKLSGSDIDSVRSVLKSAREQMRDFITQNGNQDLTSDQASQINVILDKNNAVLGLALPGTSPTPQETAIH